MATHALVVVHNLMVSKLGINSSTTNSIAHADNIALHTKGIYVYSIVMFLVAKTLNMAILTCSMQDVLSLVTKASDVMRTGNWVTV